MDVAPKKICFVVSSPLTVNAFLRGHISELSKHYTIYIVANFDGFEKNIFQDLPVKEVIDVEIVRSIRPHKDVTALNKLTQVFRNRKFDAVHSVTPKAGLLAMIAAKRAKVKNRIHIFTGQVWHTKKGAFKKLLMNIDKMIVRSATQILVDGRSQRDYLIQNQIIREDNSAVLGLGSISGVDVKRFVPDVELRKKLRKEAGFSDDEVIFTFLGRMNADKGIKELALSFDRISQKYERTKLFLIGFDEENMMDFMMKNVKNKDRIIFFGPTKKPEETLQAADIFCLPSHREGFGTSVLEAALLGLPVICSDTYGLQDAMVDHVTGVRHQVKNVDSLFEAMDYLYKNSDKRKLMGESARKYVLGNFSGEQITDEWVKFYQALFIS